MLIVKYHMTYRMKKYSALDGLKTISCIGIIMMHMAVNNKYSIGGVVYNKIIPAFTNLVFLFMAMSAFGMCCGYCEKIIRNEIDLNLFYKKRFQRVLPFFSILVLIDIIVKPSYSKLYEAFANLTLLFGFSLKRMTVIGVAWFLGTVFVFYIIFPFFCVCLKNKRRAWFTFLISVAWGMLAIYYFGLDRMCILYSGCFFVLGGIVYLYRKSVEKMNRLLAFGMIIASIFVYCLSNIILINYLIVTVTLLIYVLVLGEDKKSLLTLQPIRKLSNVSLEMYLSHMFIFRIIEKMRLNSIIRNDVLQYIFTVIIVVGGSIVFSVLTKKLLRIVGKKYQSVLMKKESNRPEK